jgi:acyl carrier protein
MGNDAGTAKITTIATDVDKVVVAIRKRGIGADLAMTADTRLRDDLGLDSANLIELTVIVHTLYGVDLGRRAAERNALPATVGEVAALLATP